MATVDLEQLATALRAAGWSTEVYVSEYTNEQRLGCAGATVSPSGHCWFDKSVVVEWDALDIIRRAVSPSAPRVDEITIPRELAERAMIEFQLSGADVENENGEQARSDAATLRAMLEGTA